MVHHSDHARKRIIRFVTGLELIGAQSWKARLSGYEDLVKGMRRADDENCAEFREHAATIKTYVADSNAAAQAKGECVIMVIIHVFTRLSFFQCMSSLM